MQSNGQFGPIIANAMLHEDHRSWQECRMVPDQIPFRVRPAYHGSDLLVEILGDHRSNDFPKVAAILSGALHASQIPHPENLDHSQIALLHDRYFTSWVYAGGKYEIDDDTWGLFLTASEKNKSVIADIEQVLTSAGPFVKEFVDFEQYR